MKIRDVRPIIIKMPFVRMSLPLSTKISKMTVVVQVTTDEGITGVGESYGSFPDGAYTVAKAIETMIKPVAIGKDPMAITALWDEIFNALYFAGRGGITIAALSGFEMALWDIKGKALNTPVYQLLGGQAHDRIRAYASFSRYNSPEEVVKASEMVVKKGFTALKLHQSDVVSVAATRNLVGDEIDIMLDADPNWRPDPVTAVRRCRELEKYKIYWFEEPVFPPDDYDGLAYLKARTSIPLAAGENEYTARGFNRLIELRAVDYLQPSVDKIGGILQQKKVFAMAEAFNRLVATHSMTFGPAMAATLHVCFSEPGAFIIETSVDMPEAPIFADSITAAEKGFWKLPDGPGLGIDFDQKALQKYIIK